MQGFEPVLDLLIILQVSQQLALYKEIKRRTDVNVLTGDVTVDRFKPIPSDVETNPRSIIAHLEQFWETDDTPHLHGTSELSKIL